jgi:hypothetical protein
MMPGIVNAGLGVFSFPSTYPVSVKYSEPGISTASIKLVIGGYLDRVLDLNSAYHVRFTSNPTLYFFVIVCMEHYTFIVYFTDLFK